MVLICACAVEWKATILTRDKDFQRFAQYLPIELYPPLRLCASARGILPYE